MREQPDPSALKGQYNIINMSSYRQILYHLVFRTKKSQKTLNLVHVSELYAYTAGFATNKNCFLYRINGVENHLHLLIDLHPSIALAAFMRDVKTSTSVWLKQSGKFPDFQGWADGYSAPSELRSCSFSGRGFYPRLLKFSTFSAVIEFFSLAMMSIISILIH
jgi:REP element-mobilizing transposase RayT